MKLFIPFCGTKTKIDFDVLNDMLKEQGFQLTDYIKPIEERKEKK